MEHSVITLHIDAVMSKYFVYVIELDSKVADNKKFRINNPRYIKGNGCVYVGQSTRKPKIRFEQHKEGYKSNNYAKIYNLPVLGICRGMQIMAKWAGVNLKKLDGHIKTRHNLIGKIAE